MYRIVKRLKFDAAHKLLGYEGLCKYTHGHSFKVDICLSSEKLDDLGMVIDFSILKKQVNKIIDKWDHSLLLNEDDEEFLVKTIFSDNRVIGLPCNPTAENLARILFVDLYPLYKDTLISIEWVRVWESETGYAEYSL